MRILLITPLFPPDIADPAPYVKELAARLAATDTVTVIAYNHIPEAIPGVTIISIAKKRPLLVRLFSFTRALLRHARRADVIYAQNGPSTELPAAIATFFASAPLVLRLGDVAALLFSKRRFPLRLIQRFAIARASVCIVHAEEALAHLRPGDHTKQLPRPMERPEILPFAPYPENALRQYETSWQEHVASLKEILYGKTT